jgi:hypothetical protein
MRHLVIVIAMIKMKMLHVMQGYTRKQPLIVSRLGSDTGFLSYYAGSILESLVEKEPNSSCAHI